MRGTDGSGHIERHTKINIYFSIKYVRHQKKFIKSSD